jgi:hypothetical protein
MVNFHHDLLPSNSSKEKIDEEIPQTRKRKNIIFNLVHLQGLWFIKGGLSKGA